MKGAALAGAIVAGLIAFVINSLIVMLCLTWAEHGFRVYDDHGHLVTEPIQ